MNTLEDNMEETLYEIMRKYYGDFLEKQKDIREVIVEQSFPIVWFGNMKRFFHSKIKVVTIGLNPSNSEFPNYNPELRFPEAHEAFEQGRMGLVCDSLNGYFDCNREPYWEWFNGYERALSSMPFGVTYGKCPHVKNCAVRNPVTCGKCPIVENYAIHIDFFSAIATDPTYSGLKKKKFLLQNTDLFDRLFHYLTDNWDEPVIVLFSTSKYEICARVGLNNQNKFYEKRDNKNDLKVEAYKLNNKIYIWGKPNIKPFQGVTDTILKESLQEICHLIGII